MKNKKWFIILGIVALLAIFMIVLFNNKHHEENDNEIKIGVLSFLTGDYANIGNDLVKGASVFLDTNLQSGKKIVLIVEDGKGTAKDSFLALQRLLQKKPKAIIVAGDYQVPAVAKSLNENQIPAIATIVGNGSFLKDNTKQWVFRDWLPISQIANTMANYVIQCGKYKQIAILYVDSEWGHEAQDSFTVEANGKIKIVACQSYSVGIRDLRPQIASILSKKPDAIYLSGYGPSYISAVNQIREASKIDIITETSINNPETKKHIKDFSNIYFSDSGFNLDENETSRKFKQWYYKKYGNYPTIYAAFGYDAMHLLVSAIDQSDMSNISIRNQLKNIKGFDSLNGHVTFLPDGNCSIKTLIRRMDVNGNPSADIR